MKNKVIILIVILYINVVISNEIEFNIDNNYKQEQLPKVRNEVRDSFKQFVRSVIKFFNISIGQLEARRRKIKKGFYNFIDVSFRDKKVDCGKIRRFSNSFPNVGMALSTLILSHGYHIETHTVLSVDGYMLTVHKIKPDVSLGRSRKTTVLLQHGLFGSSADWFLLGPEKSLPYMILRTGCEVWLSNSRGNVFSKSHVTKSVNSSEFWDFSLHDIGLYDLSATIDYIHNSSQQKSEIIVIGHSSGSAALLILLSAAPHYNNVLKLGVLLAPLVYVSNAQGSLKYVHYLDSKKNSNVFTRTRNEEFVPKGSAYQQVRRIFCMNNSNIFTCLRYGGKRVMEENFSPAILDATSSGGSEKLIIHYFQMMKSGHFRKFDYGRDENIEKYGQRSPPSYDLQDVTAPILVFSSSEDFLSVPEDVSLLLSKLPNVYDHIIIRKKQFSHIHFLFDAYVAQLVYNKIYKFLD